MEVNYIPVLDYGDLLLGFFGGFVTCLWIVKRYINKKLKLVPKEYKPKTIFEKLGK